MMAQVDWAYSGHSVPIQTQAMGQGPKLLMLPALSSISTLQEMEPLQTKLGDRFSSLAVDWPGFGTSAAPALPWSRSAFLGFLDFVLDEACPAPLATIAAGHAAGYLLLAAARRPGIAGALILLAPTWRGPLPTMMKRRSRLGRRLTAAGDLPMIGEALYRVNVNRPTIRFMAREHVYDGADWLSGERLQQKRAVTERPNGRFASIRFVTGELDPMSGREDFLAAARSVTDPILVVYGNNTPPRSKAEMDQLAALPHVQSLKLPHGKLSLHEEYPDEIAQTIAYFLTGQPDAPEQTSGP